MTLADAQLQPRIIGIWGFRVRRSEAIASAPGARRTANHWAGGQCVMRASALSRSRAAQRIIARTVGRILADVRNDHPADGLGRGGGLDAEGCRQHPSTTVVDAQRRGALARLLQKKHPRTLALFRQRIDVDRVLQEVERPARLTPVGTIPGAVSAWRHRCQAPTLDALDFSPVIPAPAGIRPQGRTFGQVRAARNAYAEQASRPDCAGKRVPSLALLAPFPTIDARRAPTKGPIAARFARQPWAISFILRTDGVAAIEAPGATEATADASNLGSTSTQGRSVDE